jgi:hypothetical protein
LRNRKRFVKTLGVTGLGLGMLAGMAGAPLALAQQQAPGIEHQLFQHEDGALDLSDEELRDLLIQLLREREQETGAALAVPGDEDAFDMLVVRGVHEELRIEAYQEFTQALADELGLEDADAADAAIRAAMMATVDANTGLDKSGREQQKALIADAAAPIGPTYRGHGG